jgi:hypothetical protein
MDTVMIAPSGGQEVEVLAKAKRRRFTAEYKRRILREADRCREPGEIGALLRPGSFPASRSRQALALLPAMHKRCRTFIELAGFTTE